MISKHIYNDTTQKLDSIDQRCSYCELMNSKDKRENYFLPLFAVQDRTNVIIYSSVKFTKIEVEIPRCSNCYKIHIDAENKAQLWSWLTILLVYISAIYLFGIVGGIAGIFGCIFIYFTASHLITNYLIEKSGILKLKEGVLKNETVQELVISGWSFNHPSA
jgi:hypothetical protein